MERRFWEGPKRIRTHLKCSFLLVMITTFELFAIFGVLYSHNVFWSALAIMACKSCDVARKGVQWFGSAAKFPLFQELLLLLSFFQCHCGVSHGKEHDIKGFLLVHQVLFA